VGAKRRDGGGDDRFLDDAYLETRDGYVQREPKAAKGGKCALYGCGGALVMLVLAAVGLYVFAKQAVTLDAAAVSQQATAILPLVFPPDVVGQMAVSVAGVEMAVLGSDDPQAPYIVFMASAPEGHLDAAAPPWSAHYHNDEQFEVREDLGEQPFRFRGSAVVAHVKLLASKERKDLVEYTLTLSEGERSVLLTVIGSVERLSQDEVQRLLDTGGEPAGAAPIVE
jgi:hypothetical protein